MGVHQYKLVLVPKAYFGQAVPAVLSEAAIDRGE
jgi:hypothetical protein